MNTQKLGLPAVIAVVVLAVVFLGFMARNYVAPPRPDLAQSLGLDKHPFPDWVNQAAMQCKGDDSKLSPDIQQRLAKQFKDGGHTEIMASYAVQTQ